MDEIETDSYPCLKKSVDNGKIVCFISEFRIVIVDCKDELQIGIVKNIIVSSNNKSVWVDYKSNEKWYEKSTNVDKLILVRKFLDSEWTVSKFKSYDKKEKLFETTDGAMYPLAKLINIADDVPIKDIAE